MALLGEVAELAILLKLKDEMTGPLKNAERSLSGINSRTASVSGGLKTMGAGLATAAVRIAEIGVAAGSAVAAIAVSATKSAASFEAAMKLIQTQAGGTQQEVTDMSKAVLALAPQVGTGPEQLAAGLYHVESAGLRGAKALEILKVAAEGAKVGQADLESVTNALIAAEQSGVGGVKDMTQAMGVLNAIVGAGNMRMGDLVAAMGTGILSTAKTFGITIQSVGASLADMTDQGIPAIDAATRLRMTISLLGAPTSKAAKELKSIGIGSSDLALAMRGPDGILGAVAMLKDHLDKSGLSATAQAQLLSKAFGGGRSSSAIMTLIGNLSLLQAKQDAVNKGTGTFGAAWTATQANVDQKVASVRASLDSLRITLGERLLPVASTVLDAVSKGLASPAVVNGIDQFGQAIAAMFSPDNVSKAEQFVTDIIPKIGDFASTILPPLIAGLKIAGQVMNQAISAFMMLPQPLQAAIIGGLAVNKLSGGLIGSGLTQIAQGLLQGGKGGVGAGGGIVGGLLGVQKVYVVNMGAGGMGGGPGGAEGWLSKGLKIAGAVTIAGASLIALAEVFQGFMKDTAQAQADLQGQVDATKNQSTAAAIANLNATVTGIRGMNILDRLTALTFGGGQITQDLITAAQKISTSGLRGAQAGSAALAVTQALEFAKYEHLTAAIDPLTTALTELTAAAKVGGEKLGTAAADAFWRQATGAPTGEHSGGTVEGGIFRRGLANTGRMPSESAVAATLHRDNQRIVDAFRNYRAGERQDLQNIKSAIDRGTAALIAKQFNVRVLGAATGYGEHSGVSGSSTITDSRAPIHVSVSVSNRQNETASARSNRIGPTAVHAGAQ